MRVICDVHIAYKIKHFFESKGIETFHVNELPDSWYTSDNDITDFLESYLPVLENAFKNPICFVEIGKDYCHVVSPQ